MERKRFKFLVFIIIFLLSMLTFAEENGIKIEQTKIGNVFLEDEEVKFKIYTSADNILWEVEDFWGERVIEGSKRIEEGKNEFVLSLPLKKKGYFTLKLKGEKDTKKIGEIETSFAILSKFDIKKVESSPFGIGTHFAQGWDTEIIPLISTCGIKNIRDELYWSAIEKNKGEFSFPEKYEKYIIELNKAGIEPLIILDYGNPNYDNGNYPVSEEGIIGFTRYAREVVRNVMGKVKYFEVWNEWTGGCGMKGKTGNTPENYVELLKATYKSIKDTNLQSKVVGVGGEAPLFFPSFSAMEKMFQKGALKYMDAVSIHPYCQPSFPEVNLVVSLRRTKKLIEKYGRNHPIWITEIGWPTHIGAGGVNEKLQAEYLVRCFILALASEVEKIYWYDFMNDGIKKDYSEHNFGIIRHPDDIKGKYTPKPSYVSYAVLIRQLTGAEFVKPINLGSSIYCYAFRKGKKHILPIWTITKKEKILQITLPKQVQIYDIMGNLVAKGEDRTYELVLSGSPLYLVVEPEISLDKMEEILKSCFNKKLISTLPVIPLGTFENKNEGWELWEGKEFPGAKGEFSFDSSFSKEGSYSAKLFGDFTKGGNYVAIVKNFSSPLNIKELRFWIKAPNVDRIALRMVDKTNQTHQQVIPLEITDDWKEVKVDNFEGTAVYWGGANDGIWHPPAKGISIVLDKAFITTGEKQATIWIDKIEASVEE